MERLKQLFPSRKPLLLVPLGYAKVNNRHDKWQNLTGIFSNAGLAWGWVDNIVKLC
jgi:hypothetical protein